MVRRELAVDAEVRNARRIHRGGIGGGGREDAVARACSTSARIPELTAITAAAASTAVFSTQDEIR